MQPQLTPRDYLIERLVALSAREEPLSDDEQAEARLCRYLASISPTPNELLRLLKEQSESSFVPRSSRVAAARLLAGWQAVVRPGGSLAG